MVSCLRKVGQHRKREGECTAETDPSSRCDLGQVPSIGWGRGTFPPRYEEFRATTQGPGLVFTGPLPASAHRHHRQQNQADFTFTGHLSSHSLEPPPSLRLGDEAEHSQLETSPIPNIATHLHVHKTKKGKSPRPEALHGCRGLAACPTRAATSITVCHYRCPTVLGVTVSRAMPLETNAPLMQIAGRKSQECVRKTAFPTGGGRGW